MKTISVVFIIVLIVLIFGVGVIYYDKEIATTGKARFSIKAPRGVLKQTQIYQPTTPVQQPPTKDVYDVRAMPPPGDFAAASSKVFADPFLVAVSNVDVLDGILINDLFFQTQNFELNLDNVFVLSVTGSVTFLSEDDSLVRIILVDSNDKEYLVFETYNRLEDSNIIEFNEFCQETCVLDSIKPKFLKLQIEQASLNLDKINYLVDGNELIDLDASQLRTAQTEIIVNKLNNNLPQKGLLYTTKVTPISLYSYAEKRKLIPGPEGSEFLPNLKGFEHYASGVFSLKKSQTTKTNLFTGMAVSSPSTTLPDSFDWRNVHGENWLTSVKDQGPYGTCYAFATIGALESVINLYYNQHLNLDLSEQSLINCMGDNRAFDNSCIDGTICVVQNIGVVDEVCSPYQGPMGICESGCFDYNDRIWKINEHWSLVCENLTNTSWRRIPINNLTGDEKIKEYLVLYGPLRLSGVITNHAMLLAGYKTDTDKRPVFIMKNSWGNGWGNNGYCELKVDPNLYNSCTGVNGNAIVTPILPPTNIGILCTDKDKDNYCNWGISEIKPATCSSHCLSEKDCDDSNPALDPYDNNFNCKPLDFILISVNPAVVNLNLPTTLTLNKPPQRGYLINYYLNNELKAQSGSCAVSGVQLVCKVPSGLIQDNYEIAFQDYSGYITNRLSLTIV